uniref:Polyprotein n=1 Tax=Phanerochaete chrysosporium (strain RP-78 / ATCC MYA-4764 / FGSC 9002) TaxID=273507 RepID=Q45W65_PHACR|nr:polyprotein [Phanerochaete chrysosporium RP-78]
MPSKRSDTTAPAVCSGKPHIFDKLETEDRWYKSTGHAGWMPCELQPCPHRYSQPIGVVEDASWQVAVDPSQLKLFVARLSGRQPSPPRSASIQEVPEAEATAAPTLPPPSRSSERSVAEEELEYLDATSSPVARPSVSSSSIIRAFNSVPKLALEGSNYRLWHQRIVVAARGVQCDDLLEEPDVPATRKREADALLSAILDTLPDSVFMSVSSTADVPADVMSAMKVRYGVSTAVSDAAAQRKLFSMTCKDDRKLQAHLDSMLAVREQIIESGTSVSDKVFTDAIIASLPDSYKPIVNAYSATLLLDAARTGTPRPARSHELIPLLRAEAHSRYTVARGGAKDAVPTAASADARGQRGGRGKGKGRSAQQQQRGGNSANQSSREGEEVTCYKCQGKGHTKKVCPSKNYAKRPEPAANAAQVTSAPAPASASAPAPAPAAKIVEVEDAWAASALAPESDAPPEREDTVDEALVSQSTDPVDIYDSGATHHMTPFRHLLYNYRPIPARTVRAAGKSHFAATGVGDMKLLMPNGNSWMRITLRDVYFAESMAATLVSLGKFDDAGYRAVIGGGYLRIMRGDAQFAAIPKIRGLYRYYHSGEGLALAAFSASLSLYQLHQHLGHLSYGYIKKLVASKAIQGLQLDPARRTEDECSVCMRAKAARAPIAAKRSSPLAATFGEHLHLDVWGPAPVRTINHCRYALVMVDDHSRWLEEPLLRSKDEAFARFRDFVALIRTQSGAQLKVVSSDRGGEFTSHEFSEFLSRNGVVRRLTVHDTPEHNGVAERVHGTIFNMVRALLISSGLPRTLWGEAVRHAVWLYNRTPHAAIDFRTPYEVRFGSPPDLSGLKPFGAVCFVRNLSAGKLDARAVECRWLGFDPTSNGSRIYWPTSHKVSVERDIKFSSREVPLLEGEDYSLDPAPDSDSDNEQHPDAASDTSGTFPSDPPDDEPLATPRRSARLAQKRLAAHIIDLSHSELEATLEAAQSEALGHDPRSYAEAMRSPDAPAWQEAMDEEIRRLEQHCAWVYETAPSGAHVVGSKWVYRTKRDAQNAITGYRARLVGQGFTQIDGVDFFSDDTFAPVAKMASQRANAALAAQRDYEMAQIDIKSAFLYGPLKDDEVIYLRPPPGVKLQGLKTGQVLRLRVALYGLKQAGRRWALFLREIIADIGLTRSEQDHAVFYRHLPGNHVAIISSHVDDLTLIAPDQKTIEDIDRRIRARVEATPLQPLNWLLGIEIKRDRAKRTVSFSQRAYIDQIISRYGFEDIKPLAAPMDPHLVLSKEDCPSTAAEVAEMRHKPYRQALGALMYAAIATRPDIAYAVNQLARFAENPGMKHWNALRRVYAYLKGTRDLSLVLGGDARDGPLVGYTDADGMSTEGRQAVSGYAFLIGGAVSWSSKRQEIVALSTSEAEYVALTHAAKEALWLRNYLHEVWQMPLQPMQLYSDNQSAIALARDDRYHARSKHIDIRYHFIRYHIEHGNITVTYCPTEDMVADTLTKALPSMKAKHFASSLGLAKA